ncbi:MAG: S1C family serine protease [Dehalococcoidales bacterium]
MTNKIFISLFIFLFLLSCGLGYFSFNLNGQLNTLNDEQKAFKADTTSKITSMQTDISGLDADLNAFKTDTTNKINKVQNDVSTLDSRFGAYQAVTDGRLNMAEGNINNMNTTLTNLAASTMNARQVYDDVIGSVCQIWGDLGEGSGFVYSADGYIITCWHVVDGQSYLNVVLHDGTMVRATVVGSDRGSDVAVIKINGVSNLKPLELADSDTLRCGQPVIVIGNPKFIFETVVYGIISRTRAMAYVGSIGWVSNLFQFDAAANPGNSGGPLFNTAGQVIGIDDAGRVDAEGIKFAINSNKVKRVADSIINYGFFVNATLPGSWVSDDITPDTATDLGLQSCFGVWFISATGAGGIQTDDIAIAVDGITIREMADLFGYIAEHRSVGDTITLTVLRNHVQMNIDIVLQSGWVM